MTAVPTLPTWLANEGPGATKFAQLNAAIEFLRFPPAARLRQTVAQTLTTSGTTYGLTCTTEDLDNANGHDNSSNPSRYTAVYPGWYLCTGAVAFAANGTGLRFAQWIKNGSLYPMGHTFLPAVSGDITIVVARPTLIQLAAGEYVELGASQTSGGSLNTTITNSHEQSGFNVLWWGTG